MADSKLDQLVKGAPPPNISPTQIAQSAKASSHTSSPTAPHLPPGITTDPRDSHPSSPPQIYLNLLILESSLRLQYLSLRARLRLHLLLLTALIAWVLTFTYLLYFRPREDGSGVGGSVYWVLETTYKLAWGGGVVTALLVYFTGLYDRGIRWPRKFTSTTNRGLRQFNLKIIIVRQSFLRELIGYFTAGWWGESKRVNFQVVPKDIEATAPKEHWSGHAARHGVVEEDLAPAGDVLKLLLLPKPFSPDFREGWENWRMEYWDKENARRADLRKVVAAKQKEIAKKEGGWLWRTGWRGWKSVGIWGKSRRQMENERIALKEKLSADRSMHQKRRRESMLRSDSHSRSSSRSMTPGPPDPDRPSSRRGGERRGSSASSTGTVKRSKKPGIHMSRLSMTEGAPEVPSPLTTRASNLSTSSSGSDSVKKESTPPMDDVAHSVEREIKQEPVD
jgi:hypothetical protein